MRGKPLVGFQLLPRNERFRSLAFNRFAVELKGGLRAGIYVFQAVIAGGMIREKEDVMALLKAGVTSVSSTNPEIWFE